MICNSFKDVLHRYELDFVSNFDGKVNANLYRKKQATSRNVHEYAHDLISYAVFFRDTVDCVAENMNEFDF